jgi:hemerythrin-like domain-containing protein
MNIDKFKNDHLAITGAVADLKRLVQAGVPANSELIARAIVTMSSTIKLHLASEDRVLYPALKGAADASTARVATRFQDEMGAIAAAYSDFSRRWNLGTKVAAEPDAFRAEAGQIFKALTDRIQRENQDLYPIAERA